MEFSPSSPSLLTLGVQFAAISLPINRLVDVSSRLPPPAPLPVLLPPLLPLPRRLALPPPLTVPCSPSLEVQQRSGSTSKIRTSSRSRPFLSSPSASSSL
eukprot:761085-Hanusia_phi.AAC.1